MDFYLNQTGKVQEKIDYVMTVIRTVDRVPEKFLKHLTGTSGLYEMRIEYGSNIYRVFCFFEDGQFSGASKWIPKKIPKNTTEGN